MQPSQLRAESFARYPVQARGIAQKFLPVLERIPLSLLPLVLCQLINYDWLFQPEQRDLMRQLNDLSALSPPQFDALMQPFAVLRIPAQLSGVDWVNQPKHFTGQLSAFLWSTHQIDDYHRAIGSFQQHVDANYTGEPSETARCTIVVIGAGVADTKLPIFRRLAPHGTLFTSVDAKSAWQALGNTMQVRARQYPREHAHWYIDGGEPAPDVNAETGINIVSFARLARAVRKELTIMNEYRLHPPESTINAETATYYMADIEPKELGLDNIANPALRRFEAQVLTEGAGTQVYSTTFVQWSARECLHRAQPLTLLARFQPRQQAAAMNELLARDPFTQQTDPIGSLVDADMGAYYTWINQRRLPGADQSRFLAWFEGHNTAVAIGPSMARGTISDTPTDLAKVLEWMA